MSKLYFKDGQLTNDTWTYVEDDTPLPKDKPAIISLTRLLNDNQAALDHNAPLGVRIQAGSKEGEDVELIADKLNQLALIAIEFPVFRNGRGFSTARILREHLGFKGELRAVGEVLVDQLMFMHRCGFSSYEIDTSKNKSLNKDRLSETFARLPDAYQPASDDNRGILWRRAARTDATSN